MFEAQDSPCISYYNYGKQYYFKDEGDIMIDKNAQECEICNQRLNKDEFDKLCGCQHEYCKDCLKYYTLHKIKNEFEVITCPKDGCKKNINKDGEVYRNLPAHIQLKYQKILISLKSLNDPSFRICPHCQQSQLTQIQEEKVKENLYCSKCDIKYCRICLNPAHKKFAKCDNAVALILKRNFQFKRCFNCYFIVQKNEGCNHMTCKCGYEFCYLCGGNWSNGNHQCPPVPRYTRPRSVQMLKRKVIQRTPLVMTALNITFDLSANNINPEAKAKGFKPVKIHKIIPPARPKKQFLTTSRVSEANTLIINNHSVLVQKQN